MKARVKATGEIVEVKSKVITSLVTGKNILKYIDQKTGVSYFEEELFFPKDLDDNPDYWTRLEHQYEGMVMQGILACDEWKISPRKKEIRQEAHRKYPYEGGTKGLICENSIPIFIQGAEWADKTMIEKACEYLRQSLYNTPIFEYDEDETPVNYVCASCCDSVEEFIENFRRAMEE